MGELTGAPGRGYAGRVHDQTVRHRFFAPHLSPPAATLGETEAHHALHVLRLKVGQPVELFDGRGRWAVGRISQADRRTAGVEFDSVLGPAPCPRPRIHLAFAPPKGKRLDWLLEKAAELGVESLEMLICRRSVVTPPGSSAALARYQAICISAVRQSGQLYLPRLAAPVELSEYLRAGPAGLGILAHGGPDTPRLAHVALPREIADVTVLIGPEGGWSTEETALAEQAGYLPARLGHSILRVETAAIAMAAALRAVLEEPCDTALPCRSTDSSVQAGD